MRPPLDATGILKGVVGQAAGKLPYATTLWLLDAVARHATAASSDFFAFPFGGRANGRVYRQCRQRPQRTRVPCTVRLRRRLLRALPLPAARAAGVRLPPAARSPESKRQCLRGRACGAKRREEERAWARGARARARLETGGVAPPKSRLAVCVSK